MSEAQKIKIAKVGRKQQPSKFKEGETYAITTIEDELSGKKMSAFGKWSENWKVGDEIEGIVTEKTWTDKDGFDQTGYNIENPNKKSFTPYGGGAKAVTTPLIVDAFHIAAELAPLFYAKKKTALKLKDITELAVAIKVELEKNTDKPEPVAVPATPVAKAAATPGDTTITEEVDTIDVDAIDEEDDKPF